MSFYPRLELYSDPTEYYNDTFRFDGAIARQRPVLSVLLEPRSLIVFDQEAFTQHPHGISDKAVDDLHEDRVGPIVNKHLVSDASRSLVRLERKLRIGVTVRHLLSRCQHGNERLEYFMKRAWGIRNKKTVSLPRSLAADAATPTSNKPTQLANEPVTSQPPRPPQPPQPQEDSILSLLRRIEQKQDALAASMKELQLVLEQTVASQSSFAKEMSLVLNHVSQTVLSQEAAIDEIRDEVIKGKENDR